MSTTNDLGTIVDDRTVRFERLLPAPVARVWWFLSDPEGMTGWLTDGDVELRVGGRLELRWEGGEVEHGEVTAWEPERVLEYTWNVSGERSLVRYELTPRGARTLLVLTHTRLEPNRLAGYAAGWDSHVAMLVAACDGGSRGFRERYEQILPVYRERVAQRAGVGGELPA
jgi:uncharacterized protein YndB with AHSA1/START domain